MRLNIRQYVALLIYVFINLSIAYPANSVHFEKRGWNTFWNNIGNSISDAISNIIHGGTEVAENMGIDTAAFGARVLDMYSDDDGVYHASVDGWQKHFGYNNLYDFAFNVGTSMKKSKTMFNYNGQNYILWAWKGDYINLGAGAELGIYYGGKDKDSHWKVNTSLSMPMTLTLVHKSKGTVVNNWSDTTWWITAFNPDKKFKKVDANDLIAYYTAKFTDSGMFSAFYISSDRVSEGWNCKNSTQTCDLKF